MHLLQLPVNQPHLKDTIILLANGIATMNSVHLISSSQLDPSMDLLDLHKVAKLGSWASFEHVGLEKFALWLKFGLFFTTFTKYSEGSLCHYMTSNSNHEFIYFETRENLLIISVSHWLITCPYERLLVAHL